MTGGDGCVFRQPATCRQEGQHAHTSTRELPAARDWPTQATLDRSVQTQYILNYPASWVNEDVTSKCCSKIVCTRSRQSGCSPIRSAVYIVQTKTVQSFKLREGTTFILRSCEGCCDTNFIVLGTAVCKKLKIIKKSTDCCSCVY
jgi:hypothetical protein